MVKGLCVCVCELILAGFVSVGVWVWWCVGVRGLNRLTGRSIHGSVVVSVVVVGGVRQSVSWVAGGWVSSLSVIGWTCRLVFWWCGVGHTSIGSPQVCSFQRHQIFQNTYKPLLYIGFHCIAEMR